MLGFGTIQHSINLLNMILVGDIGGTKTYLEAGSVQEGRWCPVFNARFEAADHAGFESVLNAFFRAWNPSREARDALSSVCFGVAGPVSGNRAQMTNLPWVVDGDALGCAFALPRVGIVNDFAAAAAGIDLLRDEDLCVLQPGEPVLHAPRLVIGAGTGLGVAQLFWTNGCYEIVPGEAGHGGFAPATPEQLELWRELHARNGRVTSEDVVSGPGLARIYQFIRRSADENVSPARIVSQALQDGDEDSLHALDLFIACYGEVAGNFALATLARGGVYIAGGIAPKILSRIRQGGFLEAFNAKGVYTETMRKVPVSVVLNERLGLLGCAAIATR